MLINQPLQGWLDHLRYIFPIKALVHVGAGNGQRANYYAEWDVPCALLIEAEEGLYKRLASVAQTQNGWSAHKELISDKESEKTFFLASNPNEHGVIPPKNLTCLWRNLNTQEQRQLRTTTLESVFNSQSTLLDPINWCFIDCLPALPVIQGAGKFITNLDVIIARAILNAERCSEIGATKQELDAFLAAHGFQCVALEEERQPTLGSLLYIRDWKDKYQISHTQLETITLEKSNLLKALDEHEKLVAERDVQLEQLTFSYNKKVKQFYLLRQKLEDSDTDKEEAIKQVEMLTAQLDSITGEKISLAESRDQHAMLSADRQVQLEQLTSSCDEQTKQAQVLRQQLEAITEEKARLLESRDQHVKLASERQAEMSVLIAEVQEAAEQRSCSELQIADLEQSHHLLSDEMLRAEAQIDLIKDLLLRE